MFPRATALMASAFLEKDIHITSFKFEGRVFPDSDQFHPALAHQTSLQSLCLKEEGLPGRNRNVADILVESLSSLVNLKDLRVEKVDANFSDQHIVQLARSLPKLEVWYMDGGMLTDAIWDAVASLRLLRSVNFGYRTIFTADALLDFIEKLEARNRDIILDVKPLIRKFSWRKKTLIRKRILKIVRGRLSN